MWRRGGDGGMGDYLTSAFLNLALRFGGMLSSTLNGCGGPLIRFTPPLCPHYHSVSTVYTNILYTDLVSRLEDLFIITFTVFKTEFQIKLLTNDKHSDHELIEILASISDHYSQHTSFTLIGFKNSLSDLFQHLVSVGLPVNQVCILARQPKIDHFIGQIG